MEQKNKAVTYSLETFKKNTSGNRKVKLSLSKKPTKGELFKKANGYSKTQKRNLHKKGLVGLSGVDILKKKTKERKLIEKLKRQEKRKASTTFKRLNSKSKGKGKAQPKAK